MKLSEGRERGNEVVGRALGDIRRRARLTQVEIATKLGVSKQSVGRWECGVRMPHLCDLPALAEAYEVTPERLAVEIAEATAQATAAAKFSE